ncbi:ISXO2-like transposase domain-containing protein [Novosphingobium lubricantis]
MPSAMSAPHFHNEEAAYAYVEARIWPEGPVCPHCGGFDRISKMQGKSTRVGAYKCYQCRKPFTVKIGTIFEDSKVAMHLWLQAMYLIAGSKKGISSNQLHRILGVTLKTAWFMSHRIREAMQDNDLGPLGGLGASVEADETFIGFEPGKEKASKAYWHKMKVVALVERNGRSRAMVVDDITIPTLQPILLENVHRLSKLHTDEAQQYKSIGRFFYQHHAVHHTAGEYVRGKAHTNSVEGYFSIFKRGMKGVYQHCAKKHLHRYVAEFNFRYSNRDRPPPSGPGGLLVHSRLHRQCWP